MARTSSRARLLTFALAAALLAALVAATPATAEEARLRSEPPPPGSFGLVVWGGGPVDALASDAARQGCSARSVWSSRAGGGLVGYLFGAPEIVNSPFLSQHGGGALPDMTPLILVCAPTATPSSAPAPTAAQTADEARMLALVNAERGRAGLAPFTVEATLTSVARAHSVDMRERDFFDHTNPDGESPFDRMSDAGVDYRAAAENLALAGSVDQAHQLLMESPGHRANILNPQLGTVGIGIVSSARGGVLVTQAFTD